MSDVLVLCYHAVSPTWRAALSISPEALESQLRTLVKRGWKGTTFTEAVTRPRWPRTLAITFDDAFLSVLERAHPILDELGLPGTVFVPTSFVAKRRYLQWPGISHWSDTPDYAELECMDWNDLGVLAGSGWEIGSHTQTHPRLTELDDDTLTAELEESRRECTQHLGRSCDSIAYPFGNVDARVAARAEEAGYVSGAALSHSLVPQGALRWPRVGIYHEDASWRFRLKVSAFTRRARASRVWPAVHVPEPVGPAQGPITAAARDRQ